MAMYETKAWYQSQKILGALVAIGGTAMSTYLATKGVPDASTVSEQLITNTVTLVGTVTSIFGRIKANKAIK